MTRAEAKSEVRDLLAEFVPAGLVERVRALVRPCVTGESESCAEADVPVGGAKFGGDPDVPGGFEWPTGSKAVPCWFVAQLPLAELKAFDIGHVIPSDGLMLFFYHDSDGAPGPKSRVLLIPRRGLRRVPVVPDERYGGRAFHAEHFPCRTLRLGQGYVVPSRSKWWVLTAAEWKGWDRAAADDFAETFNLRLAGGTHQFFGPPQYGVLPRGRELVARFGLVNDSYVYTVPTGAVEALDFGGLRVAYECS